MWRTEKISFNSQFDVDNVKVLRKLIYKDPVDVEKISQKINYIDITIP